MIEYKDSDHSYTSNGVRYISATTLISKFKYPTNWQEVATAYAKKNGETAEYWLAEWAKLGKEATDKGSGFHKKKEKELTGSVHEDDIKYPPVSDYKSIPDGTYSELLIWNDQYKIAGQADKVVIETKLGKRYVDIYDYKTNKEIKMESYKHWRDGYQYMQGPLNRLMCCHYSHYNLQLSLYAWMLSQYGLIPRLLQMEHYPNLEKEAVIYKLNYLEKEVVSMLQYYKQIKK